ncbi:MAG: NAD-dependent epimerase/dehydratase family protein [Phycisphaerae bacterium]
MIFVLGGRGFVGSAFVRALRAAGREHVILDRASYAAHAGQPCDLFINANGNSRKPLAASQPLVDFDASVRVVRQTLVDFPARAYLLLSSCDVYPDCSDPRAAVESTPLDPARQSPYGFHKHLAEQCVQHAANNWLVFRMGGLVGPGLWKNAIFDILKGGPLWLHPDSQLQFMSTDWAATTMLALADRGLSGQTFNLAGAGVIALRDALAAVPHAVTLAPDAPRVRYEVSVDRLRAHLPVPDSRATVLDFIRAELARRDR